MEANVIKELGKDIRNVFLNKGKKIDKHNFIEVDFAIEVIEAKLKNLSENAENYAAKKYMKDEYDFPTDGLSEDMIDTICHFAECFAKFYNFEVV